jgi:CheY-like chemotaxis protein
MQINTLPCFYHPATVLVVDDNQRFLDAISLKLGRDFLIKPFSNPKKAKTYIEQYQTSPSFLEAGKVFDFPEGQHIAELSINVDISAIHHEIYQGFSRFERISILIIDYAMPGMNGIDFCKYFPSSQFKKILLTGEADHQIAVDAFNKGLIDKFLLKTSEDCDTQLKEAITQLQTKYFVDLSDIVLKALRQSHTLFEPSFVSLSSNIFKKLNVKEYYLIDEIGSMLLLDADAKVSWLIVKDEEEVRSLYELASDDPDFPPSILNDLREGKQLPLVITAADRLADASTWRFYKADYFDDTTESKRFFYTLVTEQVDNIGFDFNNVKSYNQYIESLE